MDSQRIAYYREIDNNEFYWNWISILPKDLSKINFHQIANSIKGNERELSLVNIICIIIEQLKWLCKERIHSLKTV